MLNSTENTSSKENPFQLEQFADIRILRYNVPGFENLSLKQKKLVYFLNQAALCGRDILADQNCKYNLLVRRVLEHVYVNYTGDKSNEEWEALVVYLKRIWFSNGIHHHYSTDKIKPGFSPGYFLRLINETKAFNVINYLEITEGDMQDLLNKLLFDPSFLAKKVSQNANGDLVKDSAVNFYDGVSQAEAENFYNAQKETNNAYPISYGLNSTFVKNGKGVEEDVWKVGGKYSGAIEKICYWLEKAVGEAENELQKKGLEVLVEYYKTGDLRLWDEYNILWVKELDSRVDYVNGFVETYSDPLGMRGTWESIVNFKDLEATKRTAIISNNAQWFEDHSPIDQRFKKKTVKGVSAKVITVSMLGGDCYPHTPIGINLPNADWIRKEHGSKSVTIENITYAYSQADLSSGFLEEFSNSEEDMQLERNYGAITDNLHTDLHECLGHGSGQMLPGINSEMLKNYASALEETRADLFALYFMMDPKAVELGLLPNAEAAKAHYISYIRNGLMTQLRRIEPGKDIEQAHMRNRQLIASWVYDRSKQDKSIEVQKREGKTTIAINDFQRVRNYFGELLAEVQRIKSEGDYEAGKKLVENYGVKVDQKLHLEVLERFKALNIPAFSGFVNPVYTPVTKDGEIIEIKIGKCDNYAAQMMEYSKEYSFLPVFN